MGFLDGSGGKESAFIARELGSIPGWERSPREENGNPLQYSCLENSPERAAGVGYCPWGHKVLDMNKQLNNNIYVYVRVCIYTHTSICLHILFCCRYRKVTSVIL